MMTRSKPPSSRLAALNDHWQSPPSRSYHSYRVSLTALGRSGKASQAMTQTRVFRRFSDRLLLAYQPYSLNGCSIICKKRSSLNRSDGGIRWQTLNRLSIPIFLSNCPNHVQHPAAFFPSHSLFKPHCFSIVLSQRSKMPKILFRAALSFTKGLAMTEDPPLSYLHERSIHSGNTRFI